MQVNAQDKTSERERARAQEGETRTSLCCDTGSLRQGMCWSVDIGHLMLGGDGGRGGEVKGMCINSVISTRHLETSYAGGLRDTAALEDVRDTYVGGQTR